MENKPINVLDYGAKPDDASIDDTEAFQRAIDEARYGELPLPLDIEDFRLPNDEPGDDGAALQRLINELARRDPLKGFGE